MTGFSRGPRRTDHSYDKTDILLLGGGAVLVLLGLGLAADSWFSPKGNAGEKPAFVASADSTRARFLERAPTDSTPPADSTATQSIPAADLGAVAPPDSAARKALTDSVTAKRPSAAQVAAPPVAAPKSPVATPPKVVAPGSTGAAVPAPSRATAPAAVEAPAGIASSWSVQAGAFGARANADRLAARLTALGYPSVVVQLGNLHRVRATGFATRDAAVAAQARIAAVGGTASLISPDGASINQ